MTDKKNIQNDWKIKLEDIDEINYEEEAVTLTKCNEMAASVDLATDTKIDIIEMKYKDLIQASIEQIDNSSDFVTNSNKEDDQNSPDNKLPINVCRRCSNYLNISYNLILTAIKIDKRLQMQLNQKQNDATSTDKGTNKIKEINCQSIKREITDKENTQKYQNDWKTEQEDIDEINYKEEAVTLTEQNGMSASIDLATEIDIGEMKYEDLILDSTEQVDNSYDYITNKITEKCQIIKQEIIDENALNYQNDTQEMTNAKNIQNGWKTEQEDIDEINYKKEAVTLTEHNKTAPYKTDLRQHISTHLPKYQCDVCEKKFVRKANLTIHKRLHSGVRPYKCDVCEKKFARKKYLTDHERVHNGERPYKCDICEKKFARKAYLTVHKRVHSKVQPYKCDVCSSSFKHLYSMKWHRMHCDGILRKTKM
ncbi:PREDICTED: zinc finger protein 765-like [Wasmannia auropunctata]|uniref:zinc finger protein 765-like n=1 Tax=Wasmannia auropunctata TaxID=64793 RepID=UPI0005F07DC8|nr:PREDICTED: zinc finger protein 765-like [Wasmannia auropunctata]